MDIMVIIGLIFACAVLALGIPGFAGKIGIFIDPSAFLLVLGGTIASTMISTNFREFKSVIIVYLQSVYKPRAFPPEKAVSMMVALAEKAQVYGRSSIKNDGENVGDGFLQNALDLMNAGLDKEFIRKTLQADILSFKKRQTQVYQVIRTMGSYAPFFGMMGTVIGVLQVLQNVKDLDSIVNGLGLGLISTLYGLLLTALVFIPISNKYKGYADQDLLTKEVILEGVLAIVDNEIPLKVEHHLRAYADLYTRKR